jgi:phosphoserine aminotransferase
MQGGATGQFALVPMNLLAAEQSADYVISDVWGKKAFSEAKLIGKARAAWNGEQDGRWTRVPKQSELDLDPNAAYLHITSNNTIMGTQFHDFPDVGQTPLIADMSSDILWRPIDVSKFGLIYAGAQKNLGPAGITLVIVRKDLVETCSQTIPAIFRYSTLAKEDSLQNTIPTFPVYVMRYALQWLKEQGGAAAMETRNRQKAQLIYDMIDENAEFYRCPVEKQSRSMMNIIFRLPSEELEQGFLSAAKKVGMVGLKGHRSVGGIRASIYNAMEPDDVAKFAEFARGFAKAHATS